MQLGPLKYTAMSGSLKTAPAAFSPSTATRPLPGQPVPGVSVLRTLLPARPSRLQHSPLRGKPPNHTLVPC